MWYRSRDLYCGAIWITLNFDTVIMLQTLCLPLMNYLLFRRNNYLCSLLVEKGFDI